MWFFGRVRSPRAGSVKSLLAFWSGGAGHSTRTGGVRSLFAFWSGGATSSVATTTTVGGTVGGKRHHVPGGRHFRRQEYDQLIAEQAAQRRAYLAHEKFERDERLRVKAEAQALRLARIEAKATAAQERQLAKDFSVNAAAAEAFATTANQIKATLEATAQSMVIELAIQEDDDEVLMMAAL